MWQLLLFKTHLLRQKRPPASQGFTMIEVLVAILVSSAFIMGTLQAMVINAVYQVRAERESQATFWIQQDLEQIKAMSSLAPFDGGNETVMAIKCTSTGNKGFHEGFGGMLRDELFDARYSDTSTTNDVPIYDSDTTNSSSTSIKNKYSIPDASGNKNPDVQIAAEKKLVNSKKNYRLVRIIEGLKANDGTNLAYTQLQEADQSPQVLRITYKVGEADDSTADKIKADNGKGFKETLAQFYTEVIPSGAFLCDQ